MRNFQDLISAAGGLVQSIIYIIIIAALLVFFWGIAKFIFKIGGDEKAATEGRNFMAWGLIVLFVMFAVWGLIAFLGDQIGIKAGSPL